jgi:hypothetical protein
VTEKKKKKKKKRKKKNGSTRPGADYVATGKNTTKIELLKK